MLYVILGLLLRTACMYIHFGQGYVQPTLDPYFLKQTHYVNPGGEESG